MRSRKAVILLISIVTIVAFSQAFAISGVAQDQPEPVPTLDPFPRPTDYGIVVAEQVFQGGRMFYLRPVERIWVMIDPEDAGDDDMAGEWLFFEDTWEEGQMEFDESITAPDGLHQPIRGFGKLWRENEAIREALGWALDPEIGHTARYQFFDDVPSEDDADVTMDYHALNSYYGHTFVFNETEGTWFALDADGEADTPVEEEIEENDAEMEPEATEEPES